MRIMLASLGKAVSADVLVIGGSIAGLTAAITSKETAPELDILVVDKATASAGWAGKPPRGAGHLSFITPEDDPEEFIKYHVYNIGCFLNDQILLTEYAYATRRIVERLELWGVNVVKRLDGKILWNKIGPFPWGITVTDIEINKRLANYAQRLGVRFIDNVFVADLLKDGEKVVWAVGFSITDGTYYILKAYATILATGSQNYGLLRLWNGTGNGIRAAYCAGAEMRNAEFGNYGGGLICADTPPATDWFISGQDFMYNAKGENLTKKYRPDPRPDSDPETYLAWYKETLAGNGPIYVDLEEAIAGDQQRFFFIPGARPLTDKYWKRFSEIALTARKDASAKRVQVIHAFQGEFSPVKVNHQMATSLPGLFAVGDVSYSGYAWTGAVPYPPGRLKGSGLMGALFSGMKGGSAAAIYARALKAYGVEPKIENAQVKEIKEKVYGPLERSAGVSPYELIRKIQDAIYPIDYSIIKSEERMKEALEKILAVQEELDKMKAKDYHELIKCIDAESMALCAEMFYRASLMRTESRGFHYREDYPEMDNKNWLKWIIIKKENEKMKLYVENIPIEKYPYKPFK